MLVSYVYYTGTLFDVNVNISAVKALDTEPGRAATKAATFLGPSDASNLMGLALQLTKQNFPEEFTENLRRTLSPVLEVFQDCLIFNKEVCMAGLAAGINGLGFDCCNFHIHHLLLYRN
jgi:hypothetical protein